MAGELELSVVIRAQDQASAALANVEKQFGGVAQRMTASAENVGAGMDRTSLRVFRFKNAVENSVASVVGQFNPALAGMFQVMDRVGDAGERAGAGFARLGVAVGAAGALLLAFLLAETLSRPLRRIRDAAQRIEEGDLTARLELSGDSEMRAVGHALNRLAETLEHEEEIRKASVADLAHEVRTPVSALLSRIEAAQDGVLADEAANLEAMHAETLRLARLLDDLARLAEAERPGLLIEKRALDLAEVGRREADALGPLFATKGVVFATELEPVAVRGDADRLGQVVSNLLSNALRYTAPGGRVDLRVRREDGWAVLEVADTGVGIAPEDLKHVFTRFWRGEKSRSRATGGSGIGLAIVHELVRAHDGRIDVESRPGTGSTFRVSLPTVDRRGLHENGRTASPDLQTPARP